MVYKQPTEEELVEFIAHLEEAERYFKERNFYQPYNWDEVHMYYRYSEAKAAWKIGLVLQKPDSWWRGL